MVALRLPARSLLTKTSEEDPLDYYYNPFTGFVYRRRLRMALDVLGDGPFEALLEVGYGSGILLPALSRRAGRLAGVDLHPEAGAVQDMLSAEAVAADLRVGNVTRLPFADGTFDALVCLSVLEHMDERTLPTSLDEIRRVLCPGGLAVLGFPVRNVVTDAFFRLVGFDPRALHPSGHRDILEEARRAFPVVEAVRWPALLPTDLAAYVVAGCRT